MPESPAHDLQAFALELRTLAYTMPAGHEDRLISLSERMVEHALRAFGRPAGTA